MILPDDTATTGKGVERKKQMFGLQYGEGKFKVKQSQKEKVEKRTDEGDNHITAKCKHNDLSNEQ